MEAIHLLRLTLTQQKELLKYINYYNKIDPAIVKSYLRNAIKASKIKSSIIADSLNLSIHTIYNITKDNQTKPDFLTFLTVCNYLELSITAITEGCKSNGKIQEVAITETTITTDEN